MITNSELKYIKKLGRKKYRNRYLHFVVEGEKVFNDFIESKLPIYKSYTTKDTKGQKNVLVTDNCMKQMTFLKNHSNILGIFSIPKKKFPSVLKLFINSEILIFILSYGKLPLGLSI